MKKFFVALGLNLALVAQAQAAYLNLNAAGAEIPSSGGATKTTRTGTVSPTTTVAFSGGGSTTCAVWNTTLPQDAPAAPTLTCTFDGVTMTTETSKGIMFGASGTVYRNGATFDPSAAWPATDDPDGSSGNRTANAVGNFIAGQVSDVYDKGATANCSSSNCSGKNMQIRVCRYSGDISDTYAGDIQLMTLQCQY